MKSKIWLRIWLGISLLITLYVVVNFWPIYYEDDDFPLFNAIARIFFLPAYFILFGSIIPYVITKIVKKSRLKIGLIAIILAGVFIYSLSFFRCRVGLRIIISFVCALLGFIHFSLTIIIDNQEQGDLKLKRKSCFDRRHI